MRQTTKKHNFNKRLQRANQLENGFISAFIDAGYYAHSFRSASASAPLLQRPNHAGLTRAPDLVVFKKQRYYLVEIKESLIEGEHIHLYTEQLRDYMHLRHEPFLLAICASSGDYSGYVGMITLQRITELVSLDEQRERVLLPIMSLDLVGQYRDTQIRFDPRALNRVLNHLATLDN